MLEKLSKKRTESFAGRIKYSAILLILFLAHSDLHGQENRIPKVPLSTVFSTDEYGGGMQNWSISENKDGFIYVANNFGLLVFDGSQWNKIEVPNNTKTRSIYVSKSDRRIYVGGQNNIGYFEPNEFGYYQFHSLAYLIPNEHKGFDDVWDILELDGKIIFSTINKYFIYQNNLIEVVKSSNSIGFSFKLNNQIIFFSEDKGLLSFDGKSIKSFCTLPSSIKSVRGLIKEKDLSYLIFTANRGVFRVKEKKVTPIFSELAEYFENSIINSAVRLSSGEIAVGTQNNGLLILNTSGEIRYHLSRKSGLSNRTVLSLYEDRFENLWVGLNNGLNYLELNSPFSIIDERSNLPGTGYDAIKFKNRVYLGTSNGLHYYDNGKAFSIDSEIGLVDNSEGQVYDLSIISDKLYLSHHKGAFEINEAKAELLFDESGTWKFSIVPNNPDIILGGTYRGFYIFDRTNLNDQRGNFVEGLEESSRVFEIDEEGDVWMTHGYKGIFRLQFKDGYDQNPLVHFYGEKDGLPSNILINVFKLNGELVFTGEQGAYRFNREKDFFEIDTSFTNLIGEDRHISFLQEDTFGNIYYIASDEVGLLKRTTLGTFLKIEDPFKKVNHLTSDDLETISILDESNILIGARDGFIHYNPLKQIQNLNQPEAFIINISVKGDSLIEFSHLNKLNRTEFEHNFNNFNFQFASPHFKSLSNISFSCQLEGFDEEWSNFSKKTSKEYTNLPPGDYRFKLRSKDIFGSESNEASFGFSILLPWYQTNLAYAAYVLVGLGFFGIVLFGVDRRYKFKIKKSEINQKKKLIHKDNELHEFTKKTEAEITQLRNDKLKVEINHKNKELATTTMHLLNKNEFMSTLKTRIKHALDDGKDFKRELKDISKEIEKNISHDEDWKHFEIHFDDVHSDFLKHLKDQHPNLSPQDVKLSAFLRMNMSSKEIANLLNISVRGVEISRYRLRKKLNLERDVNLADFMMSLK
ncbi:MAG: triple tyrosine motif-containing protein [Bacteroidota bacterium]